MIKKKARRTARKPRKKQRTPTRVVLQEIRKIEPRPELKERILKAIDRAMISRERYRAFKRTVAVILVSLGLGFLFISMMLFFSHPFVCQ